MYANVTILAIMENTAPEVVAVIYATLFDSGPLSHFSIYL